jgi:hypothetical protein
LGLCGLGDSLGLLGLLCFDLGFKLLVLVVKLLLLLEVPGELILSDQLLDSCSLESEFFNSDMDALELSLLGL